MFYDRAKIYIRTGDGGDGMIGFRREKHVPLGGPDGGDGGKGGDVIIKTNPHLNSLARFHKRNHYRAEHGTHGGTSNKTGASGESVILEVPVGTVIRDADTGEQLADLALPGLEITVLAGGRGGLGNARFTSSVHQAPRLAERGEPGREKWLELEMKLIADVGIVGVPNAGKSTLLSVVSAAKPKIADYAFTTIRPSLGVVTVDDYESMVWADIPGLIEGASDGIGLGHDFLRHVERTRVLIHLINGGAPDPLEDWAMINQELALYDSPLDKRPQLVVLNKMDLPDAIAWEPILEEKIRQAGYEFCSISCVTQQGVQDMVYRVKRMLDLVPQPEQPEDLLTVIKPAKEDDSYEVVREGNGWRVIGERIERIASMTYFEFDATLLKFQRVLEGTGISQALKDAGVKKGDLVYIGKEELQWGDE